MIYYVIEFQSGDANAAIPLVYNDRKQALKKFYEIMAYASVSAVPKHGCMIITNDLYVLKQELAYRDPVEVIEEPEEV